MHVQPAVAGGRGELGVLVRRDDRATRRVVRVLQAQQRGVQRVVAPVAARVRTHRVGGGPPRAGVPLQRFRHAPGEPRGGAQLVVQHVRAARREEPVPAAQVHRQRDQVAHRAAGHPQRGGGAEQLRGPLLQRAHGRVVVEHVVADFGVGHRRGHPLVGARDRVGTQVDGGRSGHEPITPHQRGVEATGRRIPIGPLGAVAPRIRVIAAGARAADLRGPELHRWRLGRAVRLH
ncbi:hypothetical protein GCM10020366_09910 [Saccharopolyspora gregorii]|uniref:Uncharacterized protein n=1 Tax=Saccharopolyspora gregorii TaxID=33914 RepID=A0ABP6RLZ2_9PSEU